MHSGPVTAGVLRGDRARFQLFGDTVNTGESLVRREDYNKMWCQRSNIFRSTLFVNSLHAHG